MKKLALADYTIYLGPWEQAWPEFIQGRKYSQYFVLADENTAQYCLPRLAQSGFLPEYTLIQIPAGEQHKHIGTCTQIWQQMLDAGSDRKALLINLGGGVIGDMGGFCAGTYKRGIDFVQIPTTLLSQVDASIGGKLGIDFGQVKNSIGLFGNPQAVFVDTTFLQTLPAREVRSGFAEIIKHSLIADGAQWEAIKKVQDWRNLDWNGFIGPSLRIKQRVVEADPFERGLRKALNFGHTIGHAVEGHALETDSPLLHGEAIAIGMVCEAFLSRKKTGLSSNDLAEITRFFLHIYGTVALDRANYAEYLRLMGNDKKNEGSAINFALIGPPGEVHINQTAVAEEIIESLDYYREEAEMWEKLA